MCLRSNKAQIFVGHGFCFACITEHKLKMLSFKTAQKNGGFILYKSPLGVSQTTWLPHADQVVGAETVVIVKCMVKLRTVTWATLQHMLLTSDTTLLGWLCNNQGNTCNLMDALWSATNWYQGNQTCLFCFRSRQYMKAIFTVTYTTVNELSNFNMHNMIS